MSKTCLAQGKTIQMYTIIIKDIASTLILRICCW